MYKYETNRLAKPRNSIRAIIIQQNANNLRLTGWSHHLNNTPFTFSEHSNTEWLLREVDIAQNINSIKYSIQEGSAIAVSNGSFLDSHKLGSAGRIIEDNHQTQSIRGQTGCPGSP
jgi:hypothetical protein